MFDHCAREAALRRGVVEADDGVVGLQEPAQLVLHGLYVAQGDLCGVLHGMDELGQVVQAEAAQVALERMEVGAQTGLTWR